MTTINPHQFFDLSREDPDSLTHFRSVLNDGQLFRYVEGDRESANTLIERYLATYLYKEAAVAVANGTVGLRLALRAVGVGPGDRVLVSAYSFIACAMAIAAVGAVPVPLDMDTALTADTAVLESPGGPVAAVMIVHVQGHAVPVGRIRALCDQLGVPLIEDACQGLGARSSDGLAGQLADIAVTSFQQSKQIASGEGGLVAGRAEVVERVYRMADLGAVRHEGGLPDWDDERAIVGDNLRMTEMQAALVMDQANALEDTLARQRRHRVHLREAIGSDVPVLDSDMPEGDAGSHTLFEALSESDARDFCAALASRNVLARTVWKKTYLDYGLFRRNAPSGLFSDARPKKAIALAPRILSVPTSKYLTESAVEAMAEAIVLNRHHLASER
ncbi:DegT/DnrJ/EryC1/StrS family aminotransferase [Streptomyces sp. AM 4-1-1]|uniref:aminotransferase class I/II-fold pyridoxal phosphate-dependent enzyme n=1 Tax=Streptomyces sp. AM 4-1-1 TaxID=3028710 RepID=UPI0023BA0A9D|nr:aminotransferase class I/II-fold pyridoxal phosphate-dependent enzyme [Streptomyces sp. AM 4-1-1]WEH36593.1 DegT/DnrJ/EryC1/StrS family aminotransferase [Streptomyces sp. AM 4-1-1]